MLACNSATASGGGIVDAVGPGCTRPCTGHPEWLAATCAKFLHSGGLCCRRGEIAKPLIDVQGLDLRDPDAQCMICLPGIGQIGFHPAAAAIGVAQHQFCVGEVALGVHARISGKGDEVRPIEVAMVELEAMSQVRARAFSLAEGHHDQQRQPGCSINSD